MFDLSDDQQVAWDSLIEWIENSQEPYYIFGGYAGTGKSYTLGLLAKLNITNMYFSATTNKATKVLSNLIGKQAKTIYSLLGLRMIEKEDRLILSPSEETPYFPKGSIIVVDEASMVGTDLLSAIVNTVRYLGTRFIFVGDPAQLPPVGEKISPIWKIGCNKDCVSILKQVMRNDSQLLTLATKIRHAISKKKEIRGITDDNANGSGIFLYGSQREFNLKILSNVKDINFQDTKIIAWKNKTVNMYNDMIRSALGHKTPYEPGEIILMAQPVIKDKIIQANVDDEFTILKRSTSTLYIDKKPIDIWIIEAYDKERSILLKVPKDRSVLEALLSEKASIAHTSKQKAKAWANFWELKNSFNEIRYGYSLTAHRAQGSTLKECYVDQQDILCNFNTQESLRCLYVAITRPTEALHTF